jgi:hypothetical protein
MGDMSGASFGFSWISGWKPVAVMRHWEEAMAVLFESAIHEWTRNAKLSRNAKLGSD